MKPETNLMRAILLAHGQRPDVKLFRNNVGVAWMGEPIPYRSGYILLRNPRRVEFGLCKGSSDICGWRSLIITPDMIGRRVAVFTAIETKGARTPVTTEQRNFIAVVQEMGGHAGIARTVEEAGIILEVE